MPCHRIVFFHNSHAACTRKTAQHETPTCARCSCLPLSGWFTQAVPQGHFVPCILGPLRFHRYGGLYACTASFFFSVKEEIPWTWESAYGSDEYIEGTVVYLDTVLLEESCSFAPNEEVSARSSSVLFLLA